MDPADPQRQKNILIGVLEEANRLFTTTGGEEIISQVFSRILQLEYPTQAGKQLSLSEENVAKAIHMAHSAGVDRVVRTMIQLIHEGILVADFEKGSRMAQALRNESKDSASN